MKEEATRQHKSNRHGCNDAARKKNADRSSRRRRRREGYCSDAFFSSSFLESEYRSWVLLILSFVTISFTAGLIYGWPEFRLQLVYQDQSSLTEEESELIYTIGVWSNQGTRLFVGLLRDRFGTKSGACLSLLLTTCGLIGLGLCDPNSIFALSISFFFIGFGSGAQLCLQPVAALFPKQAGVILSSFAGANRISSLVFLLLKTNQRNVSFLIFAGFVVLLTMMCAILLPTGNSFVVDVADVVADENTEEEDWKRTKDHEDKSIELDQKSEKQEGAKAPLVVVSTPSNNTIDEKLSTFNSHKDVKTGVEIRISENECASKTFKDVEKDGEESESDREEKIWHPPPSPTAIQQIKTAEYVLLLLWFSVLIVPLQFYVGIIGYQFTEWGDNTDLYTQIFTWVFAGTAVAAPVAGYAADRYGLWFAQAASTLLVSISLFFFAAGENLSSSVQIVGMVLYGIGRMGIYGLYFTNLGRRFGYANFGTLTGLGLLVTAIASLIEYPLTEAIIDGHGTVVYTISGVLVLVLKIPYVVWLRKRERLYESAIDT